MAIAQNSVIGERVRRAREERNWSKAELARRAGCSKQTILNIENGQTGFRTATITRVLDVLGLPRELMGSIEPQLVEDDVYVEDLTAYAPHRRRLAKRILAEVAKILRENLSMISAA